MGFDDGYTCMFHELGHGNFRLRLVASLAPSWNRSRSFDQNTRIFVWRECSEMYHSQNIFEFRFYRNVIQICVNSSPSSAAYMRQCTWSALVKIMACRLFGAKPLPESMLTESQLNHSEQTSVKFESIIQNFLFKKMHLKTSSAKWRSFCQGEMS